MERCCARRGAHAMGARRRRRVRGPAQRQHLHVRGPPVVRRSLLLLPRRSRRRPQAPPRVHRHLSPHALLLSISLPRRASTPTRVGCRGRPPPRWPRPRLVRLDAADSPPSSPDPGSTVAVRYVPDINLVGIIFHPLLSPLRLDNTRVAAHPRLRRTSQARTLGRARARGLGELLVSHPDDQG